MVFLIKVSLRLKKEFDKVRKEYVKLGKMFRINNESWWKQELPSEAEMIEGIDNLDRVNNRIDYVISHCLPDSINAIIFMEKYRVDRLTQYFQELLDNHLEFQHWFSGHLHFNRKINPRFSVLYEQIIRVI